MSPSVTVALAGWVVMVITGVGCGGGVHPPPGAAAVAGNTTVTVTVLPVVTAGCVTDVAPATVSVSAGSPLKLNPVSAVNVNSAVYTLLAPKFAPAAPPGCVHVIAPVVVLGRVAVALATASFLTGAVAVIAPLMMGAGLIVSVPKTKSVIDE